MNSFPRLRSGLRPVGVDSESALILKGNLAPPLVCVSAAARTVDGNLVEELHGRDRAVSFYHTVLAKNAGDLLVIHNGPFDLALACNEDVTLTPKIFDAYRDGRVCCTIVLQKLIDVARGMRKFRRFVRGGRTVVAKSSYGLDDLIAHYYGEHVDKKDTWRRSYWLLRDLPVEQWPESARRYAIYDAVLHLRLFEAQQRAIAEHLGGDLPNQVEQQRAAFALHLMGMWGVRAERAAVDRFIDHCHEEIAKMHRDLEGTGIFKAKYRCGGGVKCKHAADATWSTCPACGKEGQCRPNPEAGSRSMSEIRRRVVESCRKLQIPVSMTDPSKKFPQGQVQVDKEALERTDDLALHVLASQMTFEKHLGQWGPVCEDAVKRPVCARYEVLVETGRTACSGSEGQAGTNFQNPPRKGDVRPCFIPRRGWLYCSTDADTIELRAHAQNCLELVGWSKMAEALWDQHRNNGPDLHLRLAAAILGISPNEALALKLAGDLEMTLARQFAKIPNFGFPGGLGAQTMILYAAAQLDKATHRKWFGTDPVEQLAKATRLREIWFETWPENKPYFKIINGMIPRDKGYGTVRQLQSGRIRGDCRFTAAANGFFQGRVADAMKDILFQLSDECYTGRCASQHAHGGTNLCTIQGRSRLEGSRSALFLHDEPILEHPEDGTESDRAERQQQIVVENLHVWMKDVPTTSSAVLMRRWQKGAEPLKVDGRLVPVKPEKIVGADGKTKVKWVQDFGEVPPIAQAEDYEMDPRFMDAAA